MTRQVEPKSGGRFAPFTDEEKAALAAGLTHFAVALAADYERIGITDEVASAKMLMLSQLMNELGQSMGLAIEDDVIEQLREMSKGAKLH